MSQDDLSDVITINCIQLKWAFHVLPHSIPVTKMTVIFLPNEDKRLSKGSKKTKSVIFDRLQKIPFYTPYKKKIIKREHRFLIDYIFLHISTSLNNEILRKRYRGTFNFISPYKLDHELP